VDPDRAERYFRAALEQDRNWGDALFNLADLAHSRGNPLQARAFVQRYLDSGAVSPSILLLGYQVETALGDGVAASSHAERLRREFPQSDEARQLPRSRSAG
jgi:type IV pilus assembly protein PilF